MSRDKNAVEYLPEYMAALREMQELYKGIQPQLDLVYDNKDSSMEECFVILCRGFGLERWEKMLSIAPTLGESVEDRRMAVIAALNGDTPYTFESIFAKLVLLCGEGNVNMEYAKEIYTLRVTLNLRAKNRFNKVVKLLKQLLPCNISLICRLGYNRHITLKPFTHGFLKAYTQRALREEVVEKNE